MASPTLLIAGAGCIGCYVGGKMVQQGTKQVVFLGRERFRGKIKQGLILSSYQKAEPDLIKPDQITFETGIEHIPSIDIVLVTVKLHDTKALKDVIPDNCKLVVSLQNGVNGSDQLKQVLEDRRHQAYVIAGMVPFGVTNIERESGLHFHQGTSGPLCYSRPNDAASQEVHRLFDWFIAQQRNAGFDVHVYNESEIKRVLYGKLLVNLANAVNALSGKPFIEQLRDQEHRRILSWQMIEALNVLKQSEIEPIGFLKFPLSFLPYGFCLPNFLFFRVAKTTLSIDHTYRSSMLQDLDQKRPKTEIDQLQGVIQTLAQEKGIETPVCSTIMTLIQAATERRKGSPNLSAKELQSAILSSCKGKSQVIDVKFKVMVALILIGVSIPACIGLIIALF